MNTYLHDFMEKYGQFELSIMHLPINVFPGGDSSGNTYGINSQIIPTLRNLSEHLDTGVGF